MSEYTDIVVAGAGSAGTGFALAAKRALGALANITLVDPSLSGTEARRSMRAVAIAPDVRAWLAGLGVWDAIEPRAQPIRSMVITDSRVGALPAPDYLTFAAPENGALAHMVFADELRAALVAGCRAAGVAFENLALLDFETRAYGLSIRSVEGPAMQARLLVAADGSRSRLRHAARLQTVGAAYPQSGIVATLRHSVGHGSRAVQHFLPSGPLALLPLRDDAGGEHRTSIVWTESTREAELLVALPEPAFLEALTARMGHEYGRLWLEDRPTALPLALSLARRLVAPRLALVGDAARTIHPLAGQGLNLGLRDAAALATHVSEAASLGLDPGSTAILEGYQRDRQFDAVAMAATTDALNRLFSNDLLPVRTLRDIGLSLVDRVPGVKERLIRGATGAPGTSPMRAATR